MSRKLKRLIFSAVTTTNALLTLCSCNNRSLVLVCSNSLFFTCKRFSQLVRLLIGSRFLSFSETFESEEILIGDDADDLLLYLIERKIEKIIIIKKLNFPDSILIKQHVTSLYKSMYIEEYFQIFTMFKINQM